MLPSSPDNFEALGQLCGFSPSGRARLDTYGQQLEALISKASIYGNDHSLLWQRLRMFAGIDDEPAIVFNADELAPFIAARPGRMW